MPFGGTSKFAAPRTITHQSTGTPTWLAPTSTVAHRAKPVAIELVGPTRCLHQEVQPSLGIWLHRANDVGNLLARFRCMTSTRFTVAHHETATRPMDHREDMFLLTMRRAKWWNGANVTTSKSSCLRAQVDHVQVPTRKTSAKTESNRWMWRSPTSRLARCVWVGVWVVFSQNFICTLTTKLRWKLRQLFFKQTLPQSRLPT